MRYVRFEYFVPSNKASNISLNMLLITILIGDNAGISGDNDGSSGGSPSCHDTALISTAQILIWFPWNQM